MDGPGLPGPWSLSQVVESRECRILRPFDVGESGDEMGFHCCGSVFERILANVRGVIG